MEIIFFLPEKLTTNKIYTGINWQKRKRHKDLFLSVPFVAQKIKKFPVKITFDFYFKSRILDCTNCSYMAKLMEDCLVNRGIIPDDTPDYVAKIEISSQKGNDDMCIIKIEKIC